MSQEIITVLEYIGEKLGIVIDWTSENIWPQIMDILGRYRILQIVVNAIWLVVALIALVVFIMIWIKIYKAYLACSKNKEDNFWWNWSDFTYSTDSTVALYIMALISAFAFVFIVPTLICMANNILEWLIIPEIQFLELFKSITG